MASFVSFVCCLIPLVLLVGADTVDDCYLKGNGLKYRKEEVPVTCVQLKGPKNFAIARASNTLYFNNINETKDALESVRLNLNTGDCSVIGELHGSCRFTVDQGAGGVYAGCDDGLYRLDGDTNKFELMHAAKDVRDVFYNDGTLYFLPGVHPPYVYKYSDGAASRAEGFPEGAVELVVDAGGDVVYRTAFGVYRQKPGATAPLHYEDTADATELALDGAGRAYACDYEHDQIYELERAAATTTKLSDAVFCHGLAFGRDDDVLYSDWRADKIYKLSKC